MELILKLKPIATNPFDGTRAPDDIEEREALRRVALEVQQLNQLLAFVEPNILTNGPIPCNPDAEAYEGYLGNVNSRPNEFGYVTVRITDYRKLVIPNKVKLDETTILDVAFETFDSVWGVPVEDVEVGGVVTQVYGSVIA